MKPQSLLRRSVLVPALPDCLRRCLSQRQRNPTRKQARTSSAQEDIRQDKQDLAKDRADAKR